MTVSHLLLAANSHLYGSPPVASPRHMASQQQQQRPESEHAQQQQHARAPVPTSSPGNHPYGSGDVMMQGDEMRPRSYSGGSGAYNWNRKRPLEQVRV